MNVFFIFSLSLMTALQVTLITHSLVRPCLQAVNAVHSFKIYLMNADNHVVIEIVPMYFHRSVTSFMVICCVSSVVLLSVFGGSLSCSYISVDLFS